MRCTNRQAHLKRKEECRDCGNFIGNRKLYDHGTCVKGFKTTCYRQSSKKCSGYKLYMNF